MLFKVTVVVSFSRLVPPSSATMSAAEGQNAASTTLAWARINSVGAPAISVDAAMNLLQQSSAGDPK